MREMILVLGLLGCAVDATEPEECRDPASVYLIVADRSSTCSPDIDTANIKCRPQGTSYDRASCVFEGSYFCSGGVTSQARLSFAERAWGTQSFRGPDGCSVELVLVEGGPFD